MFLWKGDHEGQHASVLRIHSGPASTLPSSVWWIFSLKGISFPRHHPFMSCLSLHWAFTPITTPISSSLLSHKAELLIEHELN